MGKLKDYMIDQINNERNMPDDFDSSYEPNHVSEQPDGKKLYIIKDYRIWAYSYKQALELLPMIENF
jgi:hypothetical protein